MPRLMLTTRTLLRLFAGASEDGRTGDRAEGAALLRGDHHHAQRAGDAHARVEGARVSRLLDRRREPVAVLRAAPAGSRASRHGTLDARHDRLRLAAAAVAPLRHPVVARAEVVDGRGE